MISLKWWGIIIPIIIIIVIIFLGAIEIGISREETTVSSVPYNALFPDKITSKNCNYDFLDKPENQIILQTIKVKNSFFLSRVEELPNYRACLYSSETGSTAELYVRYYVEGYKNWEYKGEDAFEVPAGSEKILEVKIRPYCIKDKVIDYEYKEILLIEQEDEYSYIYCGGLTQEQINKTVRIKIKR